MKKSVKTLFSLLLIFFVLNSFGQMVPSNISALAKQSGGHVSTSPLSPIPAPPNSVLSYPPVNWDNAFNSIQNYFKSYQYFSGPSGPFNMVTIWAVNEIQTTSPYNLKVEFYSPSETTSTLGTTAVPLSSVTVNVSPVATGELLESYYQIFSYSIPVPSNNMTSGWVSVQAVIPIPSTNFFWLNTTTAPANSAWQYPSGDPVPSGLSLALQNTNPAAVPTVSEWGLIILAFSFLIIGTLVIMRRRSTATS
jgi:hypothetical protein